MSQRASSDLDSVSSTSRSSRGSPSQRHGLTPESEEEQKQGPVAHSVLYLNSSASYDYSPTTSGQPSEPDSHRLRQDSFLSADVAKTQIKKMEKEMHKMQQKHYALIKEMDQNYASIEREMHDRYIEFLSKWKNQVRTRIGQYKSALDSALAEKNALREDAENTISALQEKVSKLTKEQNSLLQRYNQDMTQKERDKEQAISNMQLTYEKQIDALTDERLDLGQRLEETQAETIELGKRNEQLVERVAEYENAVVDLTKRYEGEVDLARAEQRSNEQDLLDLMLSNLLFQASERSRLRDQYLKEKDRFEKLRQQYNISSVRIKTYLVEFEQKHGRKCETNADREPMKQQYYQVQRLKRELELSKQALADQRAAALREGVPIEEMKAATDTPRRLRSLSPRLALNTSMDSYSGTPTHIDLDRSRGDLDRSRAELDSDQEEGRDKTEVRDRPKLELVRPKGRLTPRSVSQVQGVVYAGEIISGTSSRDVKKLQAEVEVLSKQLSETRLRALQEAPDYSALYQQEIDAMRQRLVLQERKKPNTREIEELKAENARLKEQISLFPGDSSQQQSLLAQLHSAKEEIESLSSQLEAFSQAHSALNARLSLLETENTAMGQEVRELRGAKERVRAVEVEAARQIRDLEGRTASAVNTAREEVDSLKADNDRLMEERGQIEAEIEGLQREIGSLRPLKDQLVHSSEAAVELKRVLSSKEQELKLSMLQRRDLYNQLTDLRGNIRVVCRVRPLNAFELSHSAAGSIVNIQDDTSLTCETKPGSLSSFNYHAVFGEGAGQEAVFDETRRLVQSAVDGFNVCIFAYGQTGSGKTYTILGDEEHPGITPRAIVELFSLLEQLPAPFTYKVACYMVELYMDRLEDLLLPKKAKPVPLTIRKDSTGRVYIPEATVLRATSAKQLQDIFSLGNQKRHTSDTRMNDSSSRSHLVFSVLLEISNPDTDLNRQGKLSLVDLAGSERVKKTGATAERLKEGQCISLSLSALGNVIEALATGSDHVPYRNNKLTMLMNDSLGGDVSST